MQVSSALKAAGDTHPGLQRAINEDRFHYDPARGLFIVVDGVGGHAAGEKAAETALGILRTRLERETGTLEDRLREAITLANNEIHRLASLRAEWHGMACVLTTAVVANGEVVVGHVGDTRLYKVRGGRLEKLTRDHSPVGEREDAGELSEADAMQHPRRNEVYRDVGSDRHEPGDPDFIDIARVPFEPDAALLLCSDGLTDAVPSAALRAIVQDYAGHPYEIIRALIDAANDAGGKDNVTVVYAEGPRFSDGEDTRDLRAWRSAEAVGASAAAGDQITQSQTAPVTLPQNRGRWHIWALVVLLLTVAGVGLYLQRARLRLPAVPSGPIASETQIVVRPGESIGAAIARAAAGTEIVVEPGEYRERLRLKDGVEVVSRVARRASIRLPGGASETDAAVVAFDVGHGGFSGFRIVGDAATPLGTGIVVHNSSLRLTDVEITGAHSAAVEYSGVGVGSLVGAYLHDNPGAAIIVRTGASPRIAHSLFARNATSERAAATVLVEAGASPVLAANTFADGRPESIVLPSAFDAAAIQRDKWLITTPQGAPAPGGRAGRGRR